MKIFAIANLFILCAFAQRPEQQQQQQQQQHQNQQQQSQKPQQQQHQKQQQQQYQPSVPPFLYGAPQKIINEFQQLLSKIGQRSDREIERTIESWISRQSQNIQQAFRHFKKQVETAVREVEAQHQAAVAKLSTRARQTDAQLRAVVKNSSLTPLQKFAETEKIINSLPADVKQELQRAMQG
uniref:DUF148 domain-containing protein n=1 Tax=Elaeophora elaphi TaxID=1147741 RepID=A0A0R3RMN4_9BILA